MPEAHYARAQPGDQADRAPVLLYIVGEERRRLVQAGQGGQHIHVHKHIAGDQHAIALAPERQVAAGVAGRLDHPKVGDGNDLKLHGTEYAYVDGTFQVELPVGDVFVELFKGFEYAPLRQKLTIQPHQRELTLRAERPMAWRSRGWMTADTHVHFISPQTAWLQGRAEGLNLINLLASQWGDLYTNVGDLSGALSGVSRDETLVYVGTENRQHLLGHMSLLGVDLASMMAGSDDEDAAADEKPKKKRGLLRGLGGALGLPG